MQMIHLPLSWHWYSGDGSELDQNFHPWTWKCSLQFSNMQSITLAGCDKFVGGASKVLKMSCLLLQLNENAFIAFAHHLSTCTGYDVLSNPLIHLRIHCQNLGVRGCRTLQYVSACVYKAPKI